MSDQGSAWLPRTPEPELMDDAAQAKAYAEADFAVPHQRFVTLFGEKFPDAKPLRGLDLGCGPGDITQRFVRAYESVKMTGVDGSKEMLEARTSSVQSLIDEGRIDMLQGYLPGADLDAAAFDTVISNSLLHHMDKPEALWTAINTHGAKGATVFVMDLMRPKSADIVDQLVAEHTEGEPEVLREDFRASLHAAYRVDEIEAQLEAAGLSHLVVEAVSDRHLIVYGNKE